ncbi:MAG: 16S rRNA (guanine(527)-N(7))-methyltransferase RsmG [Clostridia bacterium]
MISFSQLNINLTDEQIAKLNKYQQILVEYNKNVNLTALTEPKQIWIKHFYDSACGANLIKPNAKLLDCGSGAGFPGVALKILRADLDVTLLDSNHKKIDFLKFLCQELKIDCKFTLSRVEELNLQESYDVATARAVANTATLLEYLAKLVTVNGQIMLYKSSIEPYQNAEKTLNLKHLATYNFQLPENYGERNILVFEKIAKTPSAYPRKNGKPKKFPL